VDFSVADVHVALADRKGFTLDALMSARPIAGSALKLSSAQTPKRFDFGNTTEAR